MLHELSRRRREVVPTSNRRLGVYALALYQTVPLIEQPAQLAAASRQHLSKERRLRLPRSNHAWPNSRHFLFRYIPYFWCKLTYTQYNGIKVEG